MFGSEILDVAIGVALVFLMMSFLATAIREAFESVIKARVCEESLASDIRAAASGIEAAVFEPNTEYCPRCDFKKDCVKSTAK